MANINSSSSTLSTLYSFFLVGASEKRTRGKQKHKFFLFVGNFWYRDLSARSRFRYLAGRWLGSKAESSSNTICYRLHEIKGKTLPF